MKGDMLPAVIDKAGKLGRPRPGWSTKPVEMPSSPGRSCSQPSCGIRIPDGRIFTLCGNSLPGANHRSWSSGKLRPAWSASITTSSLRASRPRNSIFPPCVASSTASYYGTQWV